MLAVLKKELNYYFYSPVGYIFISVFLFFLTIFFVATVLLQGYADLNMVFSSTNVIMLILIPILTMSLIAEEKNKKTDQLLLTAPVNISNIVIGKYLAALSVFGITIAFTFIYAGIMYALGSPAVSGVVGAYISVISLWATFMAIGIYISSFTESQIISAIFSFGIFLIIFLWDSLILLLTRIITLSGIESALSWFSIMKRYQNMQVGVIDLVDIIFFISVIAIFLFLTVRNIERKRYL